MDENQKKKINEMRYEIWEYERKWFSSLADLDSGVLRKSEAKSYKNKITELKSELEKTETKSSVTYSEHDIFTAETRLRFWERELKAMECEHEKYHFPIKNQLEYYRYLVDDIKNDLKKARKYQG